MKRQMHDDGQALPDLSTAIVSVTPPLDGNVFEPLASDINPDRSRYLADGYDPVNVIREQDACQKPFG